jgi:hypothetical protein
MGTEMRRDPYVKSHLFFSDYNQKWKMSCFGNISQYKISGKSVPRFSSCHIGSETNVTLRCKRTKNLSQL